LGLRADPPGGGQFKQQIKKIIEAEAQPMRQIEARKTREEAKLKLFHEFKGKFGGLDKALGDLAGFQKFKELKADLGDGDKQVSVTIDKDKAQPGSYQIEVSQLAARSSMISNGFPDPDDNVLGIGFVNLELGNGESTEIYVDDADSSLRGVASLINNTQNCPVRAAVIKDASDKENPWKLILTSKKDGEENAVVFPEFYFLDGTRDFYADDTHDARNAQIMVDSFPVEMPSNNISDFLPGVNLHLKQAKPDQPFTLTISQDYQKISGKVKGMVDEVNKVLEFIVKQNQIDERTDTRTTFAGDTSLQMIEYRLRNLMHEGYPVVDYSTGEVRTVHLTDLGVQFEKTGTLTFKEDKFQKLLEKDYEGISQAISGENGFAYHMRQAIEGYTRSGGGTLATKEAALRSGIKELDRQIGMKQAALERRQTALVEQFSRLEATMGAMQRQSAYLASALPAATGGGGGLLQQLIGG
jgi:flagellar hook-associated protein 2